MLAVAGSSTSRGGPLVGRRFSNVAGQRERQRHLQPKRARMPSSIRVRAGRCSAIEPLRRACEREEDARVSIIFLCWDHCLHSPRSEHGHFRIGRRRSYVARPLCAQCAECFAPANILSR